jgi:predicted nucleic acid-binding protein
LVDANVLREATKQEPDPRVLEWLRRHEADVVVDPVIVGEIRYGILLLRRSKRRSRLEVWFDEGIARLHCIPWDLATGVRWARLLADLRSSGRAMPVKDSLIAATALHHHLVVATRNRRDFEKAHVRVIDPFL